MRPLSTPPHPRRRSREVLVGSLPLGAHHPIRIQSMTTTPTRDVEATALQAIRLAEAGCEIVRVTVQGMKEAESCEAIRNFLVQRGYEIPLVADIHFFPPAALRVADFVDKVRINPGNFVDKRASFQVIEYDDLSYQRELEKIEEKFTPLVEKCKRLKRVLRIGTNHGSLSDRIMNRYGDTPRGMVESAFEFARICRKHDFHDLVFSMKSSNPLVMIEAYRLLVREMDLLGWDYPLHLGVTEAGEGEDGRVKSAVGIGTLLLEGIGDTVRVSLTEDPWGEIAPCRKLIALARGYEERGELSPPGPKVAPRSVTSPFQIHPQGGVIVPVKEGEEVGEVDGVLLHHQVRFEKGALPCYTSSEAVGKEEPYALWVTGEERPSLTPSLFLLAPSRDRVGRGRRFAAWLREEGRKEPLVLAFSYEGDREEVTLAAAAELGALLIEGIGEGIAIESPHGAEFAKHLSLTILQAVRKRITKTDFISCPSCGRTLFDLQEVSKKIRERTAHLPGVKIAIMGCIVNGPGEMADADFGYVGSKAGKIDLYVGKECVEKEIDASEAEGRLVKLIRRHGKWVEPKEPVSPASERGDTSLAPTA